MNASLGSLNTFYEISASQTLTNCSKGACSLTGRWRNWSSPFSSTPRPNVIYSPWRCRNLRCEIPPTLGSNKCAPTFKSGAQTKLVSSYSRNVELIMILLWCKQQTRGRNRPDGDVALPPPFYFLYLIDKKVFKVRGCPLNGPEFAPKMGENKSDGSSPSRKVAFSRCHFFTFCLLPNVSLELRVQRGRRLFGQRASVVSVHCLLFLLSIDFYCCWCLNKALVLFDPLVELSY